MLNIKKLLKKMLTTEHKTVTGTTNGYGSISLNIDYSKYELINVVVTSPSSKRVITSPIGLTNYYATVLNDVGTYQPYTNSSVTLSVYYRQYA